MAFPAAADDPPSMFCRSVFGSVGFIFGEGINGPRQAVAMERSSPRSGRHFAGHGMVRRGRKSSRVPAAPSFSHTAAARPSCMDLDDSSPTLGWAAASHSLCNAMTISNERLRELSTDEWSWASNIEERMAMAAELLAARERGTAEHENFNLLSLRCNATENAATKFIAARDAAIARAEKAEADAVAENKNAHALLASLDAARTEAAHSLLKYQDACNDLFDRTRDRDEAVRSAIAARAEVERLRAELAEAKEVAKHQHKLREDQLRDWVDTLGNTIGPGLSPMQATIELRAYRDRTEAAIALYECDCDADLLVWTIKGPRNPARDAKGAN